MIKQIIPRLVILPYMAWWIFWILFQAVVLHRFNTEWKFALADAGLSNLLLALSGFIIINTNRFYSPATFSYLYRLVYIFVLTLICMTALQASMHYFFPGETAYLDLLDASIPVRYMFSLLMISFMALLSGLRFYMKEEEENKKRKGEAELLLRDAELSKLRQQLQPHFLFNSLNSISSLAGSQPERARKMIQQLSDFLRGTLKKDDQQLLALSEELQHLQLYLDIEKVRFGQRLHTDVNADEQSLALKLPSLLLQPVVENAIKFGLYDTTGEVTISIHAAAEDALLKITVQNPFDPETSRPRQGTGFGLDSIRKRLYLLYARNDLLSVEEKENIFITTLTIPQNI